MKATRTRTPQARAPRRWRTPPPLIRGSAETLEGMEILREVPGETGVLLWQAYRNVMFWATAEPQDRGKLFAADAGQHRLEDLLSADVPGGIVDALVAVGRLLSAPETTSGDTIADATRTIADWAGSEGYGSTALSFAQAAALSAPRNAPFARHATNVERVRGIARTGRDASRRDLVPPHDHDRPPDRRLGGVR